MYAFCIKLNRVIAVFYGWCRIWLSSEWPCIFHRCVERTNVGKINQIWIFWVWARVNELNIWELRKIGTSQRLICCVCACAGASHFPSALFWTRNRNQHNSTPSHCNVLLFAFCIAHCIHIANLRSDIQLHSHSIIVIINHPFREIHTHPYAFIYMHAHVFTSPRMKRNDVAIDRIRICNICRCVEMVSLNVKLAGDLDPMICVE